MAILKMKKFTLLSFKHVRDNLLKNLQRVENIHVKDMNKDTSEATSIELLQSIHFQEEQFFFESEIGKLTYILNTLKPFATIPSGLKAMRAEKETLDVDTFDAMAAKDYQNIYDTLQEIDEKKQAITSQINTLQGDIAFLSSFQDLHVDTPYARLMKNTTLVLGSFEQGAYVHGKKTLENEYPNLYIETVGHSKKDTMVAILLHSSIKESAERTLRELGFTTIYHVFSQAPKALIHAHETEIQTLQKEHDELNERLTSQSQSYREMLIIRESLLTAFERIKILNKLKESRGVIFMEGWFPENMEPEITKNIQTICDKDYYLETTNIATGDLEVPISLSNNKLCKPFQHIVEMFSLPTYAEIDPTGLMMPFYFITFGLMVGDAGYGLLLFLLTGAALLWLHLENSQKNFIQMFFILSFAVILAGFVFGSFFGKDFFLVQKTPEGIPKAIIDADFDLIGMLILSVAFGFIQIIFALLVKGYMLIRKKDFWGFLFDSIFWIIALFAGLGLLLGASGQLGNQQMFALSKWGFTLSVIGLSLTQGRGYPTMIGKFGGGLYEVYGLANYVGDFISYTRIAALALSGSYIAFSFNLMATLVPAGNSLISIILLSIPKILIFLLGHALNIGLSLLGAYVHTTRLQYVEYFGKFLEGGGKIFTPLTYQHKVVHIPSLSRR